MAVMGRPKINIDLVQLEKLCKIGCTDNEIAAFFGVSSECIAKRKQTDRNLLTAYTKGHEECKMSIREMQFLSARKGSVAMLIWLGKQHLDQKDRQELTGKQEITMKYDPQELTDEQLAIIAATNILRNHTRNGSDRTIETKASPP